MKEKLTTMERIREVERAIADAIAYILSASERDRLNVGTAIKELSKEREMLKKRLVVGSETGRAA